MRTRHLAPFAVATACAIAPPGAEAAIGSDGLGDPLFAKAGNGGYDVSRYDLDLDYSPQRNRLVGRAEITATAKIDLDRFNLELRKPMTVRAVRVEEAPATFERRAQELVITPPGRLPTGSEFTVAVDYDGKPKPVTDPDGTTEGWISTGDGSLAPSEPQGSPSWYPCNDHPSDKAAFRIAVTVPRRIKAISNGVLERRARSGKRTTWVWEQDEPMATFLATVATGRFKLTRSKDAPAPALYAVDPFFRRRAANPRKASRPLFRTQTIAAWLAGRVGPYPFSSLGGIVDRVPDFPYALETQTRPLYTVFPNTGLVVHEIAHQWFGNSVTLASWRDIWLNEGFATFSEWLYAEDHGGPTGAETFARLYETPARKRSLWTPPPGDPGSAERLFARSVYTRGAMTLQALREKIGDAPFFAALRAWVAEYAYANASTEDFIALAERESGLELDEFFRIWLFERAKPSNW